MVISKVSAGRGFTWIKNAIGLVMDRPGPWIGGTAAWIGVMLVLNLIPLIGGLISQALNFMMGLFFLSLADSQRKGLDFDPDRYVELGRPVLGRLILMMILSSLFFIIAALPLLTTMIAAGGFEALQGQPSMNNASPLSALIIAAGALMSLAAAGLALAATWFATPLILLQKKTIGEAMRLSLRAVASNLVPLLIYAFILALFMMICAIPLGLGFLLGVPAMIASFYLIYEEILGKPETL